MNPLLLQMSKAIQGLGHINAPNKPQFAGKKPDGQGASENMPAAPESVISAV